MINVACRCGKRTPDAVFLKLPKEQPHLVCTECAQYARLGSEIFMVVKFDGTGKQEHKISIKLAKALELKV
jgi:hypothetical protein